MSERPSLAYLKTELARLGCNGSVRIYREAEAAGYGVCRLCSALMASPAGPCHSCGYGTTPLGINADKGALSHKA